MKPLHTILPLALILCFAVSCQDKAAMAELEAMKAQTEIEEQNKTVVRNWLKAADEGDIDGAMQLLAPDFHWYSPSNSPTPMTRQEAREYGVMLAQAFPEWIHTIAEIMATGDRVITRQIDTTTHTGEFHGIPATGNKVEFGVIVIWRLQDGQIVEMREESDMLGLFQQLGMELAPKHNEN